MTYLGSNQGPRSVSRQLGSGVWWLPLLGLTAVLTASACTGEHRGTREDDLIPAMTCTFAPEKLVEIPVARWVEAIAAHEGHIYLATRGHGIWQVPKSGGPPVELTEPPPVSLKPLALPAETSDDNYVYRVEYGRKEIVRVKKDGSTRIVLADAGQQSDSFAMLLHGQSLYWTSSAGSLHRVPKDGGAPATTIASFGAYDDDDYRGMLTIDADGAYYLAGEIGRRSRDEDPLWLVHTCR